MPAAGITVLVSSSHCRSQVDGSWASNHLLDNAFPCSVSKNCKGRRLVTMWTVPAPAREWSEPLCVSWKWESKARKTQ